METLSSNEIRRVFGDFFEARGHTAVPSASLIPADPTLLLTVAGMVPFKPYLTGEEPPPYPTAVAIQKCVRTVDIDIVGTTARHLSFFEMMGNFSFGDYFKEQAIPWAYQLITESFGIEPERLWFTVHETDDEAAEIWLDEVGVSPERLQRRGNDNFWHMGVPGPAGPSSEIFYDRGPEYGPDGGPVVDEERFVEVWNLVFMQNIQDRPYHVIGNLPAKNIDTGAGLERVSMVLQGVDNVFETDLLRPIISAAEGATGHTYGGESGADVSLRILADHARALTFMVSDGVVPSNEGRGYILRRMIRRAVRHSWQLGAEDNVTPKLVDATIDVMGDAYPVLNEQRDGIVEMTEREESRFRRTLEAGHSLLTAEMDKIDPGAPIPGETAFKLHDTYGFPVELTEEIAAEQDLAIDREGFESEMSRQRERARAARRVGTDDESVRAYAALIDRIGPTEFVGYETTQSAGKVLAIIREGEQVEDADEGQEVQLFVERTPFYAEAGGQVGDSGYIETGTGSVRVEDTQYAVQGLHGHLATVTRGKVRVGQEATLRVDADRRERIRKSHTGTHILHWALREVVGRHVTQAGSLVVAGRLRFDFSHYAPVGADELAEVERLANEKVIANGLVTTDVMTRKEAEAAGALAFFGDKYGDQVRVVDTGGFSKELCGGTHVPATGQVGPLVVVGESSIGSNLRRIEAYTGSTGYEFMAQIREELRGVAERLRVPPGDAAEAAFSLLERMRQQEQRIASFEQQQRSGEAQSLVSAAEKIGEHLLVVASRPGATPDELRTLAMQIRDRVHSGIVVLGGARDEKAGLLALVTKNLVDGGVSAGELLSEPARIVGGGGSRDPELAQAGGPNGAQVEEALALASELATERLRSA